MRKTFFLLFLLLISAFAAPVGAQETCGLTPNDAPVFFGLRLGMTPAEVKGVFGKSLKLKIRKQGSFFENFVTKSPPAFLPNVRALYLRFFDYRLYQIEIFYQTENKTAGYDEKTLAAFVDVLSANKNLPNQFWTNKNGRFQLKCAGFSLAADNVLNLRTELTDNFTQTRFAEEQERKNKKKN